jgi:hypothetical protein
MAAHQRRLRIADVLVLVAATAIGIAWMSRWSLPYVIRQKLLVKYDPSPVLMPPEDGNFADAGAYLLAPWAFSLVILRMLRPRPRQRALLNRPGFVATGVATAVILQQLVRFQIENARLYGSLRNGFVMVFEATNPTPIALAVMASWSLMVACGRWHPEASWVDRAGRAVGVAYVLASLSTWTGWPIR